MPQLTKQSKSLVYLPESSGWSYATWQGGRVLVLKTSLSPVPVLYLPKTPAVHKPVSAGMGSLNHRKPKWPPRLVNDTKWHFREQMKRRHLSPGHQHCQHTVAFLWGPSFTKTDLCSASRRMVGRLATEALCFAGYCLCAPACLPMQICDPAEWQIPHTSHPFEPCMNGCWVLTVKSLSAKLLLCGAGGEA